MRVEASSQEQIGLVGDQPLWKTLTGTAMTHSQWTQGEKICSNEVSQKKVIEGKDARL